jgi:hypothetical protein
MSALAATISPLALMASAATPVPTAIASVTGLATAAAGLAVRGALFARRFDASFGGLCLRDAVALAAAVFVPRGFVSSRTLRVEARRSSKNHSEAGGSASEPVGR